MSKYSTMKWQLILSLSVAFAASVMADPVDPADDAVTGATVLSFGPNSKWINDRTLGSDDQADWFQAEMLAGNTYYLAACMPGMACDIYSDAGGENRVGGDNAWCDSGFYTFFSPSESGTYYIRVRNDYWPDAVDYYMEYRGDGVFPTTPDEWDPADDAAEGATELVFAAETKQHGEHMLSATDAADWYRIEMRAGNSYNFEACWQASGGYLQFTLFADAEGQQPIAVDNWCWNYGFSFQYACQESGTYYLKVECQSWDESCFPRYTINYYGEGVFPLGPDEWDPADDTSAGASAVEILEDGTGWHGEHTLTEGDGADWFYVDLLAGHLYSINTCGGIGDTMVDIFSDANGANLVVSDNDGCGDANADAMFQAPTEGRYYVRVTKLDEYAQYYLTVVDYGPPQFDEWDPGDDTPAGATALAASFTEQAHGPHFLNAQDVRDWYRIELETGEWYSFAVNEGAVYRLYRDPLADPLLEATGAQPYTPVTPGVYYVEVGHAGDLSGKSYSLLYRKMTNDPWDPADDVSSGATYMYTGSSHGPHNLRGADIVDWYEMYFYGASVQHYQGCGGVGSATIAVYRASNVTQPLPAQNSVCGDGMFSSVVQIPGWDRYMIGVYRAAEYTGDVRYVLTHGAWISDAWDPLDDSPAGATILTNSLVLRTNGLHQVGRNDTADWYRFNLEAGKSYQFSATGAGDSYAELFGGADAAILLASDDNNGGNWQFLILYTASNSGPHYLRVRCGPASQEMSYTLRYMEQPYDQWDPVDDTRGGATGTTAGEWHGPHRIGSQDVYDWFSLGYHNGGAQKVRIRTSGSGVPLYGRIYRDQFSVLDFQPVSNDLDYVYSPSSAGSYSVQIMQGQSVTSTYSFRVDWIMADAWDFGDDTSEGATPLTFARDDQITPEHRIGQGDDADWYVFDLLAGSTNLIYTTDEVGDFAQIDTYGTLYAEQGGSLVVVAEDDNGMGNRHFRLTYVASVSGRYYLRIHTPNPSVSQPYRITYRMMMAPTDAWHGIDDAPMIWSDERQGYLFAPVWNLVESSQQHGPHMLWDDDHRDFLWVYLAEGAEYSFQACGQNGMFTLALRGFDLSGQPFDYSLWAQGAECGSSAEIIKVKPVASGWAELSVQRNMGNPEDIIISCQVSNLPGGNFVFDGLASTITAGVSVPVSLRAHDYTVTTMVGMTDWDPIPTNLYVRTNVVFSGGNYQGLVDLSTISALNNATVKSFYVESHDFDGQTFLMDRFVDVAGPFTNGFWQGTFVFSGADSLVSVRAADREAVSDSPAFELIPPGSPGMPPSLFALASPASGSTQWLSPRYLDWTTATNATGYDVYFGEQEDPPRLASSPVSVLAVTQRLIVGHTYRWYVVASNAVGTVRAPASGYWTVQASYDRIIDRDLVIGEHDTLYDDQNIQVRDARVTVSGSHRFGDLSLVDGAVLTHPANNVAGQTNRLDLEAVMLSIDATSSIDVSGMGWSAGRDGGEGDAGGSHGGRGAAYTAASLPCYGDYREPRRPGQGARSSLGGPGGGAVAIRADRLELEGYIRANAPDQKWNSAGAGGSILLDVGELVGSGGIEADGGSVDIQGGAGGGGRIAIHYRDAATFDFSRVRSKGGRLASDDARYAGAPGTVFLRDTDLAAGLVVVRNDGTNRPLAATEFHPAGGDVMEAYHADLRMMGAAPQLPVAVTADACHLTTTGTVTGQRLVMRGGVWNQLGAASMAEVDLSGTVWSQAAPVAVSGAFALTNDAVWHQNAAFQLPSATSLVVSNYRHVAGLPIARDLVQVVAGGILSAREGASLTITAATVMVGHDAAIDVSSRGPQGLGTNETELAGGSHGGRGGYGTVNSSPTFGDLRQPVTMGGVPRYRTESRGGGAVRIQANALILDGAVRANGGDDDESGNAAAGGSIWVDVHNVSGGGVMEARGGMPIPLFAGGGGGRIAVYYEDAHDFDLNRLEARGGGYSFDAVRSGGAGTIYLKRKSEPLGRIVIRNAPVGEEGGSTLLPANLPEPVTIDQARVVNVEETLNPDVGEPSGPGNGVSEGMYLIDSPEMRLMSIGQVLVTGMVVNASGQPIAGVGLEWVASTLFDPVITVRTQVIAGAFAVGCSNCTDLVLTFTHPDYASKTIPFFFHTELDIDSDGVVVQQTNVIQESSVVTLNSRTEPAEMEQTGGLLRFFDDGSRDILDLDRNGQLLTVLAGASTSEIPRRGITLTAQRSGGRILLSGKAAVGAQLSMTGAGDGFVSIGMMLGDRSEKLMQMRTAPASGYQSGLMLTSLTHDTYFYFKCGERYGKGVVSGLSSYLETDDRVHVSIELYWQVNTTNGFRLGPFSWPEPREAIDLNRMAGGVTTYETVYDLGFPREALIVTPEGSFTVVGETGRCSLAMAYGENWQGGEPPASAFKSEIPITSYFFLKKGSQVIKARWVEDVSSMDEYGNVFAQYFMVLYPPASRDVATADPALVDYAMVLRRPPVWQGANIVSTLTGSNLARVISAPSMGGSNVSMRMVNLPAGASFVDHGDGTGTLSWTPGTNDRGVHAAAFVFSDGRSNIVQQARLYVGDAGEAMCGGIPCSLRERGLIKEIVVTNAAGGTSREVDVVWDGASNVYYDVYVSDGAQAGGLTWRKLATRTGRGREAWETLAEPVLTADEQGGGRTRYYSVVLRGETPSTSQVWAVHDMKLPSGQQAFRMIAPPVSMDRSFGGEFGQRLAGVLTGHAGGIGDRQGAEVYAMETNGQWRILYLDQNRVWREANGQASTYRLPAGQGLFVANFGAGAPSVVSFTGPVGNVGTNRVALQAGWNLLGLSEGRFLPVTETLAGASPVGGAMEEAADLLVVQNPDGSWRRMMHIRGWGAPYDGKWFDLSTFSIVTNQLQPGQAYYYYRQPGGGASQLSF